MKRLIKNTALISFLTLCSRILGVVRDALIAMVFGTSIQSDSFFIAFRPFDLLRKLFSEGVLSSSFVPIFSSTIKGQGRSSGVALVYACVCLFSIAGVLIIILGFIFAPFLLKLIAPVTSQTGLSAGLTVYLFKIMLPYLWCILMIALFMGVFNTLGNFGVPALAPLLFNTCVITFTLFICNWFDVPAIGLALGVTCGGLVQLAVQVPVLIRMGMLDVKAFKMIHPEIISLLKIMIPCMIGAASYQVNIMTASFFAARLPLGSVSYLYYADRLVQFPLALFAVSVATVFLPEISNRVNNDCLDKIAPLFSKGLKLVLFITIPAMAGLMALDKEIVSFLFGQGAFGSVAVFQTADCLFFLVTGLWAFTGVRIFVALYYALSSFKIPFYSGLVSISLNLVLCAVLVDAMGLKGLVLAVSFSSAVNLVLLFINCPNAPGRAEIEKTGPDKTKPGNTKPGKTKIDKKDILVSACRSLFLSVIMLFLVEEAAIYLFAENAGKLELGMGLAGGISLGIFVYICLGAIFSSPELKMITQAIFHKNQ